MTPAHDPTPGVAESTKVSAAPVWAVLGSSLSVQIGAAFAKHLFGEVTPTGVTWLRLFWSAVLLVGLRFLLVRRRRPPTAAPGLSTTGLPTSPDPAARPPRDWAVGLGYAACLVGMNWAIYQAFSRIPLGVAVTIEFLGPLGVAIARSRRLQHLLWAGMAGAGVVVLEWSPVPLDRAGVGFALVAASCWAGYILFGRRATLTWPGVDVLTLACVLGAVLLATPAILTNGARLAHPRFLLIGLAIGLLSSVIPYGLELFALPRVPARVFGILMSLEPVIAALAALALLGEHLRAAEWAAMALIVAASVGSTRDAAKS